MPNRQPPEDDQPELPLDPAKNAAEAAPAAAASNPDAEVSAGDENPPESAETVVEAPLAGAYKNWFLDYASYVILDRAVPHINDGLKPVQRRILHTLWEKDDGRFHKVANIVGATMAFHPHGDASIEAALVGIAQRGYLIEPQGNFGNTLTGDGAAAARYIEARLTPFARDVLFNPKTTVWQQSYDGRAKEPVTLPAKFPLVLLEGAEGIAVGLSTRLLPHNFNDLCRASINYLQGKTFRIRPDFPTGGTADFSDYNDGKRGSRVKVRATIESQSKYVLAITELAYGTTTSSLIDSILSANTKGKIKIKHVDDNTADKVEILVHLPQGADPKQVKQQLYVFTDCQVSLSPSACVIETVDGRDRPAFLGVSEILKRSVDETVGLLKLELEIKLGELEQQWHWDSLERIFIEERIYRRIEQSKTWESVLHEIRTGLEPFLDRLQREVTDDDITRLTEIRIKRISAYNRFKADEKIKQIETDIEGVKHHLANLIDYAIAWFESLQEKYGKGRKRRTSFDEIEQISVTKVIPANQRLFVDREGGFVGLNWRQHEFVTDCRPIDQVMCIMADGTLKMSKVADKIFMGRNILHVALFDKNGPPEYFTLLYQDKKSGKCFGKRFTLGGLTRDKLYPLVASEGSKVVYFDATKNESAMPGKLRIQLSGRCKARVKDFEFDLSEMSVGARGAKGVTVTKYPVRKVTKVLGAGEVEGS
ncbi:DNA gyrase/topoisomerase IV subunit A [Synoicihabitans lomoniglobus]|uniref:DNA gyrase/topoisomerase IV subunit A n=1 Tax=Synoicihabitans lomoniglobus TaxID=2909285 RepID=A0AAE9ZU54_9BACT|nr:DNA gyrase/topoisomerase IV subunit A [Opitutaceae bacterium LMO-M01]WED65205.1 DNA gyrase/topoisomerase IV subunit A [Opitutaceae bacterium LMO-M01]